MRLKRLTVSKAKQYHDVDIDLSQVKLASIIGQYTFNRAKSNGAGKSTLGDLVMFALFETVPDKSLGTNDLVSWGASKMGVSLEFDYEGNSFVVRRTHEPSSRTKNTMELEINGVPHGKDIVERRAILAGYLGISDQIAQATWFFQQSGANKLTSADPKDRKAYLAAVLDADKYDKPYAYAKEKYGAMEREIEQSRKAASELSEVIGSIKLADEQINAFSMRKIEQQSIAEANRNRLGEINNQLAVIASKRVHTDSADVLERKISNTRTELTVAAKTRQDLETQLASTNAELDQAQDALNRFEPERMAAEQAISAILSKWKSLNYTENFAVEVNRYIWQYKLKLDQARHSIEEIQKKIEDVSTLGSNCQTCGQIVDDTCKAGLVADIRMQISNIDAQAVADKAQLDAMYANEQLAIEDDRVLSRSKDTLKSYDATSHSLRSKAQGAAALVQSISNQIGMTDAQITNLNLAMSELEQKLEESKQLASFDDSALLTERNWFNDAIRVGQVEVDSFTSSIAKWQSYRETLQNQHERLTQESAKLEALEEELKVLRVVVQLFHRDGLPLLKINSACTLIEAYANSMMSTVLPNYHLKVEVESGIRGKLDFMVNTPGGLQPYAVMSGGEKAIAGLCLRMALSRILAEGSGHRFETLFLDEVFSELDQVYRPVMMNLVKELSKSFKAIFVISHEIEIQTAFPQVVLVECDGKQSRVKVMENNEVE